MGASCSTETWKKCGAFTISIPADAPLARVAFQHQMHRAHSDDDGADEDWVRKMGRAHTYTGGEDHPWAVQRGAKRCATGPLAKYTKAFGGHTDDALEGRRRKAQELLYQAARTGDFRKLAEAITLGADVDRPNTRGCTALMMAATSRGKTGLDCIKFLVEALADIDGRDKNGWTPMLHACRNSQGSTVEWLLMHQASLHSRATDGKSCLMLATQDGADHLVHHLLHRRASLDDKDDNGWTTLFYAVSGRNSDLVKWLLRRSADVRHKAHNGDTVLEMARKSGDESILKELTRHCDRKH